MFRPTHNQLAQQDDNENIPTICGEPITANSNAADFEQMPTVLGEPNRHDDEVMNYNVAQPEYAKTPVETALFKVKPVDDFSDYGIPYTTGSDKAKYTGFGPGFGAEVPGTLGTNCVGDFTEYDIPTTTNEDDRTAIVSNDEHSAHNDGDIPEEEMPLTCSDYCALLQCLLPVLVGIGIIVWLAVTSDDSGSSNDGGVGGRTCFPSGECIDLEESLNSPGSIVPIEAVQPGSAIVEGGRVKAAMKLLSLEPMYRYNDSVFVTGSHLVLGDGNSWMPVEESSFASPSPEHSHEYVYNLVTEKHRLKINGTLFADFDEWDDSKEDWQTELDLLARLNSNVSRDALKVDGRPLDHPVGEGAFASDTTILLEDGTRRSIHQIEPGARIHGGATTISVIKVWIPDDTLVYQYEGETVTEWSIVYDNDGVWRNVRDSPNALPIVEQEENRLWYQLWTTSNEVVVNGRVVFADFFIFNDETEEAKVSTSASFVNQQPQETA